MTPSSACRKKRIGGMVHERPEPLLAGPQRLLGPPAFEQEGRLVRTDAEQEAVDFGGEVRPSRTGDQDPAALPAPERVDDNRDGPVSDGDRGSMRAARVGRASAKDPAPSGSPGLDPPEPDLEGCGRPRRRVRSARSLTAR